MTRDGPLTQLITCNIISKIYKSYRKEDAKAKEDTKPDSRLSCYGTW